MIPSPVVSLTTLPALLFVLNRATLCHYAQIMHMSVMRLCHLNCSVEERGLFFIYMCFCLSMCRNKILREWETNRGGGDACGVAMCAWKEEVKWSQKRLPFKWSTLSFTLVLLSALVALFHENIRLSLCCSCTAEGAKRGFKSCCGSSDDDYWCHQQWNIHMTTWMVK